MSPKVSVIMPVYNAHDFLRASMDSLVNQTLTDIQIICVDDGSTDDSPEILAQYAAQDSRVRVIRQENAGAGAARNHGIHYATGEYLSILDCDDFYELDMLEKSYAAARQRDVDMIVFGCDLYDDAPGEYRPCPYSIHRNLLPEAEVFRAEDVRRDVFQLFVGWSWDKLFRTSFVRENQMVFQEQRTTNDLLFVFNGLLRARRITVMPDVLVHHRRGQGSLSVTREKSWHCFYDALMALREEMYKIGCYDRFAQDYINYCLHFSLWNLNTLAEPTHTLLYNKLREEWFREMGVLDHPQDYFYNKSQYRSFQNICKYTAEENQRRRAMVSYENQTLFQKIRLWIQEDGLLYTLEQIFRKIFGR